MHLVVWLKTPIPVQPPEGYLGPEEREVVKRFVRERFVERLEKEGLERGGGESVLWFKNWVSLQSVRGLDHIHVLVRDVPRSIIDEWTAN